MKPGQIITTKKINDWKVNFRLPKMVDAEAMMQFINQISKEKVFISRQGEQISLTEEKKYVQSLLKKIRKKQALVIQAWHNKELIGIVDLKSKEKTERHVAILGLLVKKEYRNCGIGSNLLKVILEQARKHLKNTELVILQVYADNSRAIHLYKKLGFKEYGKLPRGLKRQNKYHDAILMYLDLKSS